MREVAPVCVVWWRYLIPRTTDIPVSCVCVCVCVYVYVYVNIIKLCVHV